MPTPMLLGEDEHTLLVQSESGQPVTLPKASLQQHTLDQMRALPMANNAQSVATNPYDTGPSAPSMSLAVPPAMQMGVPMPADVSRETDLSPVKPAEPALNVGGMSTGQNEYLGPSYYALRARQGKADANAASTQNQLSQANTKLGMATQSRAEAVLDAANTQANIIEGGRLAIADHEVKTQQSEMARQKALADDMGKVSELQADIASKKVDNNRLWANANTSQKIGAGIAMAMSALGNALTGQGGAANGAWSMIQESINKDIAAQREQISGMREDLASRTNMLGQTRARFGDERQAEAAALLGLNQQVKMKAEQYKEAARGPEAVANADFIIAQADTEMIKNSQVIQAQSDARFSQDQTALMHAEQGAGQLQVADRVAAIKENLALAKEGKGARTIDGYQGEARSDPLLTKATDLEVAYQGAMVLLNDLEAYRTKHGSGVIPSADRSVMRSKSAQVLIELKNLYQLGVLSVSDQELINKINPEDPAALGFVLARIQSLRKDMHRGTAVKMRVYGFRNRSRDVDPFYTLETERDVDAGELSGDARPQNSQDTIRQALPQPAATKTVPGQGLPGVVG